MEFNLGPEVGSAGKVAVLRIAIQNANFFPYKMPNFPIQNAELQYKMLDVSIENAEIMESRL